MKESKESEDFRAKYGKGFDIIRKMGFKGGGLGVDGTGISEPIQVQLRPTNLGIVSETNINSNQSEKSLNVLPGSKNLEKRNKKQKTSIEVEKAKEIIENSEPGIIQVFPKKAHLDDIMESVSVQREIYFQKKKDLEEYLNEKQLEIEDQNNSLDNLKEKKSIMENLSIVTKQIQRAFLKFHYDLEKIMEDEIMSLFEEQKDESLNENEDYQDQMDSLEKVVDEFSTSFNGILNSCTDKSSREVSKSYLPYCSMIRDILRNSLKKLYKKDRDMKLDPDFGITTWISIKTLFVSLQTSRKEKEYDSKFCFEQLVLETVGKYLEVYFMCSWDPIKEDEYGISLLKIWINLIPFEFIKTNLMQVIWNKQIHHLQINKIELKSVGDVSENTKYKWIFKWLPYYYKFGMGYQVSKVISKYIYEALDEWEPPEEWPLSLLTVWKPILETQKENETEEFENIGLFEHETHHNHLIKQELDNIILSSIYPKLLSFFNINFQVEQDHKTQQLDSIDHLELWFEKDLIDRSLVSQIFMEVIGPKWIKALESKLSNIRYEYNYIQSSKKNTPNFINNQEFIALYKDLLEWYQFWRQIFSTGAIASAKSKAFLAKGLIYMDYHINFYSDLDPEIKKKTSCWINYDSFEDEDEDIPELQDLKDDTLILNVLEWISDETGLVLKQSGRKNTHGRQIYSIEYGEYHKESRNKTQSSYFKSNPIFSKLFFYIYQGVIFIREPTLQESNNSEDWTPVSIPKMLAKLGIEEINR
ncbi:tuftelin-interacting G-patch domain-containing protein [Cryptosporidium ubiquitum]|uniref:Tuftelin-interacting G-patch domain-containing protein n=1 Tax=Cryptosporidium ubiquitum TaxID=857276 RepID=A0A1J4MB13_9CRYT|nr:tuftelin-interacting G-patch domain-containing protein [Cryptosporidium ubiquitum]OII71422.1 tuftelin-interacting G-patch domain-containing protein [Cryptosporidium ubiquitum]